MAIYIPVDLTGYYQSQTLEIQDEINARSTARFGMVDVTATLTLEDGAPIEIYDYSGNLIFGGFINYPRRINPLGTDALFFDIEAIDQHEIADRYLVAEAFVSQTAGYIVNTILTNYLSADGVIVGNIEAGITLDVAKFPRANTVAEVLDNLAEICGFVWYIDFDKKLYFQERNATVAGFNLVDNSAILNINVRNDRSKYRNRQYIRGGQTPTDSPITGESPTPKPDGTTRTFVTRYPIAQAPTIYINSVAVPTNQIGINGVDGQVTPLQWYWSYGSNTITQDTTQAVLSTSDTITIDYIGLIPLLVVVEDSNAIAQRATIENLSGVYESLETLPNVNDKQQALDIANGKLRKYTVIPRELTYQTFTNGLSAGQLQTVTLSKYGISAAEFLIDRVTIRDLDDQGTFVYDVHAIDGEPFGSWTKFFESLVRKESGLVIDTDEKLIVLKTSYETDYWSETHAFTIFSCPVVADTLYPSDTLYPC
jgi:hypothetical protein